MGSLAGFEGDGVRCETCKSSVEQSHGHVSESGSLLRGGLTKRDVTVQSNDINSCEMPRVTVCGHLHLNLIRMQGAFCHKLYGVRTHMALLLRVCPLLSVLSEM